LLQHGGLAAQREGCSELNGEEEPMWLTPYLRDPQPEERAREIVIDASL